MGRKRLIWECVSLIEGYRGTDGQGVRYEGSRFI